jgi:hypothetical protein
VAVVAVVAAAEIRMITLKIQSQEVAEAAAALVCPPEKVVSSEETPERVQVEVLETMGL